MSRFWSKITHALTPYVPGEQPQHAQLVKLNTNECPYPPSPRVMDAIQAISDDSLRRYPDPSSLALRETIAANQGLGIDNVFVGNGSDEVLAHAFQGLLAHEEPLLFPDISYSFYPVWCQLYGLASRTIPLAADFSLDLDDYRAGRGAVIIPNPNAPTGLALPLASIRQLLDQNPDAVVVIDEAYVDYGAESAAALVPEYENLLVVQTLSKSRALAGLRVGFALGNSALIEGLTRVKDSFNSYPLDALAQAAARAAVEDVDYFDECRQQVMATRASLSTALTGLGFEVLPSQANFVFARHPEHDAAKLFAGLRQEGVIVRHWNKPRIDQYLRISIGTESQTQRLLEVLTQLL
ncbi:MAG: histidinol-phosphate transaminase [Halieaceae bacterium]|nr:histidinol-phosphate transaminase [Halieaceae bacterium]